MELGWKFRSGTVLADTARSSHEKEQRDPARSQWLQRRATAPRGIAASNTKRAAMRSACSRSALAGTFARHEYAFSRAIEGGETIVDGNDVDTAPRNVHSLESRRAHSATAEAGRLRRWTSVYVGQILPRRGEHGHLSRAHGGEPARLPGSRAGDLRARLRVDNLFDTRYADRADFAFGNYRYFPARGRAVFLSLDYATQLKSRVTRHDFPSTSISGADLAWADRPLHQDRPEHDLGLRAGRADVAAFVGAAGVRRRGNPSRNCCARAPASAPCAASAPRSIRRATCAGSRTK